MDGDVVDGTEQVDELDLEVQNVGDEQRKDQLEGHRDESILYGGQQDGDRLAAGKDLDVVHEPYWLMPLKKFRSVKLYTRELANG